MIQLIANIYYIQLPAVRSGRILKVSTEPQPSGVKSSNEQLRSRWIGLSSHRSRWVLWVRNDILKMLKSLNKSVINHFQLFSPQKELCIQRKRNSFLKNLSWLTQHLHSWFEAYFVKWLKIHLFSQNKPSLDFYQALQQKPGYETPHHIISYINLETLGNADMIILMVLYLCAYIYPCLPCNYKE